MGNVGRGGLYGGVARPQLSAWAHTSPLLQLSTGRIIDTEPLTSGPVLTVALLTLMMFAVAAISRHAVARAALLRRVLLVPAAAVVLLVIRHAILIFFPVCGPDLEPQRASSAGM